MRTDTLWWAALALFGLVATAQGVAALLAGTVAIGSYVTVVSGLVVLGGAAVAIARGETLDEDATLARVATVAGALLYAVLTIGRHVL